MQDVPIANSAFGSTALKERAVADISALSGIAPNVNLDGSTPFLGSSAALSATIRDIGSDDFALNIDPGAGRVVRGVVEGSADPQSFIPQLISYYREGRFPFDRLIEVFEFEAIADAFVAGESGRVVKPVLCFS